MNTDNPVTILCAQGMRAEAEGRPAAAAALFRQAWNTATDDYDACVAAHYLARHQTTPQDTLHWNQTALTHAERATDPRIHPLYPSLHLCIAQAHTDLNAPDHARTHYTHAAQHAHHLPPGPYTDMIRAAIAHGLRTTGALPPRPSDPHITTLLNRLTDRRDHRSLALLLPAHITDLQTPEDDLRLTTTLHLLHASRTLPDEDTHTLTQALATLT
ncbi:hypothetical protein [Actinocorallia sp. A-T 12471]|uniref:hypothetical protein n=1 Tax=Actinocorallia sp. A-T 12471 TaxID=3089813 RepID=UPI0029D2EBC7|nr:hypothetical protein [Actinocorallia sp. A-T 12471]MDX6743912.1 hypothetical protein [Actinocorallia sp. A-T 12471]